MSKRRKKTRGNPAKADQSRIQVLGDYGGFLPYMRQVAEDGIDDARQNLLKAGATEDQIDTLMRVHRCRIAYEALEVGDFDTFERVVAPIQNEIEIRQFISRAEELGMPPADKEENHEH